MKRFTPILALGVIAGLSLVACAGFFAPIDATDTRSQQQIVFDDACWSVKTAEATFTAFNARGAVNAEGVAQFTTIATALDAACAGPIPTDPKQFASKVLIETASILSIVATKPAS